MSLPSRPTPKLIGGIVGVTLVLGVFAWMRGREVEITQVSAPGPTKSGAPTTQAGVNIPAKSDNPSQKPSDVPAPSPAPTARPVEALPTPRSEFPDAKLPRRKITFFGTLVVASQDAGDPPPDFTGVIVRAPAYSVEAFPSANGEFTLLLDLPSTQNHVRLEVEWPGMIFAEVAAPPAFGKPYLNVPLDGESEQTRAKIEMRRLE